MTRALGLLVLCAATLPPARAGEPVALFDGKDTARWYTFLRDHGKNTDPNGNFTVRDGIVRISGGGFGRAGPPGELCNLPGRARVRRGRRGLAAAREPRPRQRAARALHRPG